MDQHLAVVRLLDEVIEHLLGDLEVGDDAIFHRFNGDDVAGGAAEQLFGLFAVRLNFIGVLVEGDDRRLVHYDSLAPRIH